MIGQIRPANSSSNSYTIPGSPEKSSRASMNASQKNLLRNTHMSMKTFTTKVEKNLKHTASWIARYRFADLGAEKGWWNRELRSILQLQKPQEDIFQCMEELRREKQVPEKDGGAIWEVQEHTHSTNLHEGMARHHHEEQSQQNQKWRSPKDRSLNLQNSSRLWETHQEFGGGTGEEVNRAEEGVRRA